MRVSFKWIRIVRLGTGYMLTTEHGFIVGTRLDRGRGKYPECKVSGLSYDTAIAAAKEWEAFRELNNENHKRTDSLRGKRVSHAPESLSEFGWQGKHDGD